MVKLNPLLILVGVLLVAFVFLFMASSSSKYVPYNPVNNEYATYENMTEFYGEEEGEEVNKEEEAIYENMTEFYGKEEEEEEANYKNMTEFYGEEEGEEGVQDESHDAFNVIGGNPTKNPIASIFSGLFPGSMENFESLVEEPNTISYGPLRDSEIIDKFSQVNVNGMDGVNGCVSSGLSNAGGYICLTPELIQLLKTRGGNASGK
jgi:hypothetical protein